MVYNWKQKDGVKRNNIYAVWERRMAICESLRKNSNIPRKRLCFIYGVGLLWTKQASNSQEVCKLLCEFNKGFNNPLSTRQIYGHFKNIKAYKFSDAYICQLLNIDGSYFAAIEKESRDHQRYMQTKKKREKLGKTKIQEQEKRRYFILENRDKYSIAQLAEILHVSVSTIKRDLSVLKNKINTLIDMQIPSKYEDAAGKKHCPVLRIKTSSPTHPFLYANKAGIVATHPLTVINNYDAKLYEDDKTYQLPKKIITPLSKQYAKFIKQKKLFNKREYKCTNALLNGNTNVHYANNLPMLFHLIDFYIQANKNEPPYYIQSNIAFLT